MSLSDEHLDEQAPLLRSSKPHPHYRQQQTPLPKLQIGICLFLQVCEPLTSQSIYPYINKLVSELDITGGDQRNVGYYAGLIESLFFATEALTILHWSRMSDHIGRKPILLIGLFGSMISMLCFGLSRTFWALVLSRCLTGLLNGNIGVMKSVMGELTDSSNRAEGFSLLPVVWGLGATLGQVEFQNDEKSKLRINLSPLIGGTLARPQERFPTAFTAQFWKEYPYFLPCLVTSSYVFIAFIVTLALFKETVPRCGRSEDRHLPSESDDLDSDDRPLPLRRLLVYPVILSVSNYVVLAFLNIAICALLPLFLAMPLEIGGLGFDPPAIGYIMGSYGAGSAIFQAFYFARIVRYFGERKVFIMAMSTFIPIYLCLPAINMAAVTFGKQSVGVWLLITLLLACLAFMDMAYGTIFMFVTASSPNKRSLGATNGLSQTSVSIARAIGPAFSTSLFSFCVRHEILGGFGVYGLFAIASICALFLATRLPHKVWDASETGAVVCEEDFE